MLLLVLFVVVMALWFFTSVGPPASAPYGRLGYAVVRRAVAVLDGAGFRGDADGVTEEP